MTENKDELCPKGWAWMTWDCDFADECWECTEPEAPIMQTSSRSPNK